MVFAGYNFTVMYDDSIMFDTEIKPEQMKIKDGDVFVAKINDNGTVILQKQNG
jgi:hypothetical protein